MENETEVEKVDTHHERHESKKSKNNRLIIIGVIVLIVLIIIGGIAWLYTGQLSGAKEKVFSAIPLPAALVGNNPVSAKEALGRIDLAKQLAATQGLEDTASTDIYDQLLETKKLNVIASKHNLSVSQAEIDEEYTNIVKQYAGGDENKFKEQLETTYHMAPDKFKNEVIKQELLQSELSIWYSQQQDLNKDAYATAKDLQGKLDGGQSFDDVANAYTQDETTKDFAGDSGMIAFDDLLPEFKEALKDIKVNDTKLVSSRFGLHMLKVLELNNDGPDGAKQIHLQQIFVKQTGFTEWLKAETDKIKVTKLLKF